MINTIKNTFSSVFCLLIFFSYTACSANNLQTSTEPQRAQFEQAFADLCVEKEIRNSVNREEDRQRFSIPCSCIAKRIATDLAIPDIDKFLNEKKSTHALNMSFDEAAYFCVQKKKIPKSPDLFGRK